MEGLPALQERVQALLKRYAAVHREREQLRKEVDALREERESLEARLRHAEESLLALHIGKSMPDEATRARSRKKLDAVISEIDKILTTLND
jgi:chromosome segregation ATPase